MVRAWRRLSHAQHGSIQRRTRTLDIRLRIASRRHAGDRRSQPLSGHVRFVRNECKKDSTRRLRIGTFIQTFHNGNDAAAAAAAAAVAAKRRVRVRGLAIARRTSRMQNVARQVRLRRSSAWSLACVRNLPGENFTGFDSFMILHVRQRKPRPSSRPFPQPMTTAVLTCNFLLMTAITALTGIRSTMTPMPADLARGEMYCDDGRFNGRSGWRCVFHKRRSFLQ